MTASLGGYTWVEPFAGAAAVALRLVGGRNLTPPVAWMGGKRRYARAIADAMGVPDERPSRVVLADAGPWGWVWPLLLKPKTAKQVASILLEWAGEEPRALWGRLVERPPFVDQDLRAAQWLFLQSRIGAGVPVWWQGRWVSTRLQQDGGVRDAKHAVAWRGAGHAMAGAATIADRIEGIALAFSRIPKTEVHHCDAGKLAPHPGFAYLDPPYLGATGYGWDCQRADVLILATAWADAGAIVAISEAVPLEIPGWHHLDLTRECGKPEWLTLSREPVRVPDKQAELWPS